MYHWPVTRSNVPAKTASKVHTLSDCPQNATIGKLRGDFAAENVAFENDWVPPHMLLRKNTQIRSSQVLVTHLHTSGTPDLNKVPS